VGKDSLEYYNVLHTLQYDYFKNCTLQKVLWENQNGSSMASL